MFLRRGLAALALSLLLLLVQGTASAHELDHATGAHDAPCALHVFANDMPGTPASLPTLPSLPRPLAICRTATVATPTFSSHRPFAARAPPAPV
ncbi:MAG: hypothetical protein A2140_06560 [Candidatus Muproteobacteria bacterium RBG_16_62_13]|uniref:Cobalt transporter n=1 Tax=Candidatus Muproteobacteria bacterium RBG_16_62_13 TaxID=1817756 RepID=A0A1F6T3M8_9PROT|nr:MAG: hypothetical protein A2140_06560 [Candidatus Muproteobacteria bacterium RBG_16_62_13]